jgi:flavin-dependent dehydrogenase
MKVKRKPFMSHDPKVFDVAILGAGLSGLIAATRLAKENRSVLLLKEEKYSFANKASEKNILPNGSPGKSKEGR